MLGNIYKLLIDFLFSCHRCYGGSVKQVSAKPLPRTASLSTWQNGVHAKWQVAIILADTGMNLAPLHHLSHKLAKHRNTPEQARTVRNRRHFYTIDPSQETFLAFTGTLARP